MSMLISETPYTGGDKHCFQCCFGRICTLRVVEIRYSDGSAGNTEAGTTSFTQRSVHGHQPEPLVNVNNSNIFKCKQKVFLCFIIVSLKGSFKNDHFKTKSLNYTMQLRAGDGQCPCGRPTEWQATPRSLCLFLCLVLPVLSDPGTRTACPPNEERVLLMTLSPPPQLELHLTLKAGALWGLLWHSFSHRLPFYIHKKYISRMNWYRDKQCRDTQELRKRTLKKKLNESTRNELRDKSRNWLFF